METPTWSRRVPALLMPGLFVLALAAPSLAASDLTSAISPAGLDFVAAEIPQHLPKTFTHAGFNQQLLDCPLSDTNVNLSVSDLQANLEGTSVVIRTSPGEVTATVTTDAGGSFKAAVTDASCYFGGSFACKVTFSAKSASGTGMVTPEVQENKLRVPNPNISVDLPADRVTVTISECGLIGDLLNLVIPYVKNYAVERVRAEVEKMAKEQVPPLVEKSLASMTELSAEQNDISVVAKLDSVLPMTYGIMAGIGMELQPKTEASCTLAEASTIGKPTDGPYFQWQTGEHLGVAVPRETLARAIQTAWKGGQLCLSPAKLQELGLPAAATNLFGLLLGMTSTESMTLQIVKEPTLELVAGAEPRVKVALNGVEILLQGQGPAGATTVKVAFTLDVDALVRLDPVNRSLMLEVGSLTPRDLALSATKADGLKLDNESIKGILESAVLPMVSEQLAHVPLVSTILHRTGGVFDPYYLYISRAETTTTYVKLFASVYRKPAADTTPPTTTLLKQPDALTRSQVFTFIAQGEDDATPFDLIRLQWQVDGADWTQAKFSRGLTFELKDGQHTVSVRAVDLNDNVDPQPVLASFQVDGIQPTVTITTTPPSPLQGAALTVEWQAVDNLTAANELEAKAKVTRSNDGDEVTVLDGQFKAGRNQAPLSGLLNGSYTVTVLARDKAGNLSVPATITFDVTQSVDPPEVKKGSSGCSVAGRSNESPLALLVLVAALVAARTRVTARALRRRATP